MDLSREDFVEHFKIPFLVQCLMRAWVKRRGRKWRDVRDMPIATTTVRETILVSNAALEGTPAQFDAAITPALVALDERTPKGERPSMEDFAGCIYEALDVAGLWVRIGPPQRMHGALNVPIDNLAHLRHSHDVRLRLADERNLPALERMAEEIASTHYGSWQSNGYTIFSFATQAQRDRFEAAAVEVVNGEGMPCSRDRASCKAADRAG